MSPTLIFAIITITLALIAYSFGVISEYRSKNLQWKQLVENMINMNQNFKLVY